MHVIAEITYNCPADCSDCFIKKLNPEKKKMHIVNFEKAVTLFSSYFRGCRKLLTISGGEPSVCKDLSHFVQVAKENGFTVTVATNGYNPERILEAKPDYVQISVDYVNSRHNGYRKLALWNKILFLVEKIKEGEIKGFVRFTLRRDNLDDLIKLRMKLQDVKIFAMPIRGCPEIAPTKDQILTAMNYAILPTRCPAGKGQFVLTPDMAVLDCIFHRKELGKLKKFTVDELDKIVKNGRVLEPYPCGEPYWWSKCLKA